MICRFPEIGLHFLDKTTCHFVHIAVENSFKKDMLFYNLKEQHAILSLTTPTFRWIKRHVIFKHQNRHVVFSKRLNWSSGPATCHFVNHHKRHGVCLGLEQPSNAPNDMLFLVIDNSNSKYKLLNMIQVCLKYNSI